MGNNVLTQTAAEEWVAGRILYIDKPYRLM